MFKNHPKGLLPAALANMGERFGFYTMMAILTLFLMSKFGLDKTNAGLIYSVFYFSIYILAFVGGLIADKTRNYKGTILVGLIVMALGYLLIAVPTPTPVRNVPLFLTVTCVGLFTIAFGNGLFKGNLQALVGQMYDNEKYEKMRDSGFSLFYMFINVGAIFAPLAAVGMRNGWLSSQGFLYDPDLPELCHGFLRNSLSPEATARFQELAATVSKNGAPTDMTAFADGYLGAFATGFHFAFGIAIFAMLISLVIYLANKRKLPDPRKLTASGATSDPHTVRMAAAEVKKTDMGFDRCLCGRYFLMVLFSPERADAYFFRKRLHAAENRFARSFRRDISVDESVFRRISDACGAGVFRMDAGQRPGTVHAG